MKDERCNRGLPILDLTDSNPTRCRFQYPQKEILEAFLNPDNLSYEPDPKGSLKARTTVADYYLTRSIEVNPNNLFLTASTSEAYTFLFRLLMNVGDEILVPRPSYPLIEYLAQINDIEVKYYHLLYDDEWHIDFESIRTAISKKTKSILLIHPNNPTGSYVKKDEYLALAEIALSHNLSLIADEVFLDYSFFKDDRRLTSFADKKDVLTFTVSGISKILGLPQMKLAWIAANGRADVLKNASQRLEVIADSYLSVSTPVQNASPSWFKLLPPLTREVSLRIEANMNFLRARTAGNCPVRVLQAEGGWNATLRVPKTRTDEEWAEYFLVNHGIVVQPGYFYDFDDDGFLVVSLLTEPEQFQKGIRLILAEVWR